jgi:hypothetical protein
MSSAPVNAEQIGDVHDIRRRNLRFLIDEYAGGNLTHFVEVTLRDTMSYKGLQRVTSQKMKRNLGSTLARRIEKQLQFERGWMDHDRSGAVHTMTIPGGRSARVVRLAESIESLTPPMRILIEKLVTYHKRTIVKRGVP